jgi:hypothetical protein
MCTFAEERYDFLERYYMCRLVGRARTHAVLDPIEEKGVVGVE